MSSMFSEHGAGLGSGLGDLCLRDRRLISAKPLLKGRASWFTKIGSFVVSFACLSALPSGAQQPQPSECRRVLLSQGLGWTTSGVWAEDGERLFLADVIRGEIVAVSPQGAVRAAGGIGDKLVSTAGDSSQPQARPSQIRRANGGYLVEDEQADNIAYLDGSLDLVSSSPVKDRDVAKTADGGEIKLVAIYDWSPLHNGFLAFGDLQGPGKNDGQRAFVYYDDDGGGEMQVFYSIPALAPTRHLYTKSNLPYIAVSGDVGYILLMRDEPVIGEVRVGYGGIRELQFFPREFQKSPKLEESSLWEGLLPGKGARRATAFFQALERSTAAVGLFANHGYLFLLAKSAMASDGDTAWFLIKLDPLNEARELSRVELPTKAAHLTVVPGNESWALVEKGPVEGIGASHAPYMKIDTMVLVSAALVEGAGGATIPCDD